MKDPSLVMSRMRLLHKWMDRDSVKLEEWDDDEGLHATPHQEQLVGY